MPADEPSTTDSTSAREIIGRGAVELARSIAAGELASREVVQAHIKRIEEVNARLNAVVAPLFDEAIQQAEQADRDRQAGKALAPLHGVPVTVKECFHVAGTASTLGLSQLAGRKTSDDGILIRGLRAAGAIVLGKTNVPQLMLSHETNNPLFGRTNNPWNLDRTPGGSSGGEAAMIAAGGSPLGLGSDLGGSIRVPCHFSGICGIKPTSQRLPRAGSAASLRGMEAFHFQPGPMARRVDDLTVAMRVLTNAGVSHKAKDVVPAAFPDPDKVRMDGMRIAVWSDDGYFRPAPAVRRAVEQAAVALDARGVTVVAFQPPLVREAMRLYYGLAGADGGADARRLLRGSRVARDVRRLVWMAALPGLGRIAFGALLGITGQRRAAMLVSEARARSADAYWRLTWRMQEYSRQFWQALEKAGCEAMLCPPHALPALPHGAALDLIPAASYAMLFNLLEAPAGVVPWSSVGAFELSDRPIGRDLIDRKAARAESGSEGLPVGIQVAAPPWREDVVLAIMKTLETAAPNRPSPPL